MSHTLKYKQNNLIKKFHNCRIAYLIRYIVLHEYKAPIPASLTLGQTAVSIFKKGSISHNRHQFHVDQNGKGHEGPDADETM